MPSRVVLVVRDVGLDDDAISAVYLDITDGNVGYARRPNKGYSVRCKLTTSTRRYG